MIYLSWQNVLDSIVPTIDNSSSDPSLIPITNLQNPILHRPWRTDSTTLTRAEFDLSGVSEDIDVIALMGMKLAGQVDSQIVKYTTYNPASPGSAVSEHILDPNAVNPFSGLTNFERCVTWLPDSGTTGAYITVELQAASSNFVDIGRAWAGPIWQLDHGRVIATQKDTGLSNRSFRKFGWPVKRQVYKEYVVLVPLVRDDDIWNNTAMTFFEAMQSVRKGAEVIMAPFPDGSASVKDGYLSQRYFFYGTVLDKLDWRNVNGEFMGMQFTFQELF